MKAVAADTQKVLCPWCRQPCVVLGEQRRPAFRDEREQTYRGKQGRQVSEGRSRRKPSEDALVSRSQLCGRR